MVQARTQVQLVGRVQVQYLDIVQPKKPSYVCEKNPWGSPGSHLICELCLYSTAPADRWFGIPLASGIRDKVFDFLGRT